MKNNLGSPVGGLWILRALGALTILMGLFLAVGGAYLAVLGGSLYFVLAGVALLVSGLLIARGNPSGALLFALTLVATAIWAVADAGLHFWPLVSRLVALAVLGLLIALAYPTLARASGRTAGRGAHALAALLAVALIATGGYAFVPTPVIAAQGTAPTPVPVTPQTAQKNWQHWGNTTAGDRFAALDQITKSNVNQLEVAWTAHTGDIPVSTGSGAEDQNTPLQIGDTVYVCTAYGKVLALNADTGAQLWKFDPQAKGPNWQRCRGLGYFDQDAPLAATAVPTGGTPPAAAAGNSVAGDCRKRLLLPTLDARLIALDATSGQPCAAFGNKGTVDLSVGMGEIKFGYYQQTSTPLIAGGLVIVGGRVADNWSVDEPPGVVRAFDVVSGELVWAWDSGNPAVTRLPADGKTYTRGAPNVWAAMSYDPKLDLVYLPTGNATPDFFGGHRTAEEDKYSSSIVALEGRTGKVRWHFQTTHHDLWDFDLPAQPLLYDVPNGQGGTQPALIQTTKQGEIFMFNRETGVPIAEVQEKPVPQGSIPGERYSPTQPFSVGMPSIGNTTLTESDMWGATPFDALLCRISFKGMRSEGVYTPPGLDHALQMPGSLGGMNWGSVSVDPTTATMFVNDMRLGLANYMIPRDKMPKNASGIEMGAVPQEGTPFGAMRQRFLSQLGIPCQAPPFGTMTAIDLKTRKIAWQVPVGTVRDTGPLGIKMHLPIPIGMPTLGPSLATQSGLVFFAGTQDFYLRAFDSASGKEVWKARLPVGSQGGPMTYVSPATGRQYVVITAGGARQSPDRGDYVIAYALPASK
ncbi:membrane-bound PQQ-dependent dehydrogenase, glucose/quinate/shikimate family [Variovorax ginsengisoli]|uniref:Quinate dehydrogenase (Quinone) n=1 Tax=Variovorax ginsengisoli TaxID=363844 RepID=A0ABT9SDN3_9BURK|nr:membrane-bound PQQ-dependent dehydrogenase, glucose/quinate/shikimate family [Variovorax ginsengisoli]MDP9901502.1 quinate dehydrogenase (quinone) [Variovorax ginsengisoli]